MAAPPPTLAHPASAAAALAPRAADLTRLAFKYETLGALRRERSAGAPLPGAATFKALAREFPGALQELDTLPLELIDARATELHAAARAAELRAAARPAGAAAPAGGGEADDPAEALAPWMRWLFAWHALMRGALLVKAALRGARDVDDERAADLAARAAATAGVPFPVALVHGVARPPDGRIARLVLAHAAECFEAAPEVIADAVFPASAGRRRRTKSAAAT
ncbi:MAG: hypothetical protein WKG00_35400 [Polyangiaceae bacterium]